MKKNIKKYLYLVNDITNIMLNKESVIKLEENAKKLRIALIVVSVLLLISVFINLYLIFE